ncbi:transposase [Desulfurobacterium sp.]|uniref:RNA-guided endonuclease InsQ/TnpB family protein n=1 Tax=Desulfurobacterium sp. TaxID=2004706 RepID=UPI002613C3C3|nr:transposase [Desulfurobacterium sp.]
MRAKKASKKKKFSKRWRKQAQRVARIMQKIACIRHDFLHKLSTGIAKSHGMVLEDLKIRNMSKCAKGKGATAKSKFNRLIQDLGWGKFLRMLEYKCEQYWQVFLKVSPPHTSHTCSACGFAHPENRRGKVFVCPRCGHKEDAGVNAARVILQKDLAILGFGTAGPSGSDACGEGNSGGTGINQVYEPSLAKAGIPRLKPWEGQETVIYYEEEA